MTNLNIYDPDQEFGSIFHRGGVNQEFYKFDPVEGDVPDDNGLAIKYDKKSAIWALYSANVSLFFLN